jgi:hypothetical protein
MDENRPLENDRFAGRRIVAGIAYRGTLRSSTGRVIFGLLIVALGVLFTLDNLGVVSAGEILRWWPAALLLYGLARLTGACCRQSTMLGTIFALAGALLLLREAQLLPIDPWDLWPVVLIIIGAAMLARALQRVGARDALAAGGPRGGAGDAGSGSTGGAGASATRGNAADDLAPTFETVALLSSVERKILSQRLRRGEVVAIMGGQTLDLRGARLADGTATLDLVVVMGGVDLYVPPTWKVSVETVTLLGGFEDASRAPAGETSGHLILKGVVLMGGVEVKN